MRWWMCRLLLGFRSFQVFLSNESGESVLVRDFIGVEPLEGVLPRSSVRRQVQKRLKGLGSQSVGSASPLGRNTANLATLAGLSEVEREILAFVVLMQVEEPLRNLLQDADYCNRQRICELLAVAVDRSRKEVRDALSSKGVLAETGFLKTDSDLQSAVCKFQLMDGVAEVLMEEHASESDLLRHFFTAAPETRLSPEHFGHLCDDFNIVSGYLKHALDTRQCGTNVLLHGVPGAGKTEFARVVAAAVGATLYQVAASQRDSPGRERLGSYALCQRFLAGGDKRLVLFDEIEDVFPSAWDRDTDRLGKARLNDLLESNSVPTIWVSNEVSQIDEAYLRRFDYSVRFDRLPTETRRGILASVVGDRPQASKLIEALEGTDRITPGFAVRALRVADGSAKHGSERVAVAKRVAKQWNALVGARPQKSRSRRTFSVAELAGVLNVDCDIADLISSARSECKRLTMLFYGPPGTGKTELARAIAIASRRPLNERRPSDLLGSYVGQSERNVAGAFRDAEEEQAVLLLDEVDALLSPRESATHTWEISLVSELLMAIEGFDGLLICATNHVEALDRAVLRRFDVKVRFDYMSMGQRIATLHRALERRGISSGIEEAAMALRRVPSLSIGEFAAVERRLNALHEPGDAMRFVELLAQECELRGAGGLAPGFVRQTRSNYEVVVTADARAAA